MHKTRNFYYKNRTALGVPSPYLLTPAAGSFCFGEHHLISWFRSTYLGRHQII